MNIAIIGTGSFALSIAYLLEKNNYTFTFIGRDENQLQELQEQRHNHKYSHYCFTNNITTKKLDSDMDYSEYDVLFYCLPSSSLHFVRNTTIPIVFTNKGFENFFLFERFSNYCILSGGSFATEILNGTPCYVSVASKNEILQKKVQNLLQSSQCILSLTDKTKDVEILGIYKNIIAVFCGIVRGLELGKNISSAFMTKCLEYIIRFYELDKGSLLEPAGIGDLFLSCASSKSRNFSYGSKIVLYSNYQSAKLVEGLKSLKNLYHKKPNSLLYELHDVLLLIQKRNHKDATDIIHAIISEGFFFQN
jgi:glycerol-3-phosphate dehydrogenase (NAD(P)+)